jgi:hypothetical protein
MEARNKTTNLAVRKGKKTTVLCHFFKCSLPSLSANDAPSTYGKIFAYYMNAYVCVSVCVCVCVFAVVGRKWSEVKSNKCGNSKS